MSLFQDKNKSSSFSNSSWFKLLLTVMFYYSCYNPDELEIIYEGTNDYTVYSYDTHECGIDNYSEDSSEYSDSNDSRDVGEESVSTVPQPVYWQPPMMRFW